MSAQVLTAIVALAMFANGAAQSNASSVAGHWRMNIDFQQGAAVATIDLKQQGEIVTGTFDAGFAGGSIPIEGEFSHGKLVFSGSTTSGPHPGMSLDFAAMLNEDKLTGTFSWQAGDFSWTAERTK